MLAVLFVMPPNGVEVRGLRVLRTHEDRRVPWWRYVLTGLSIDYQWSVLTVSSEPGELVARRRFARDREAEAARRRFVGLVAGMSEGEYAIADWQAVLDAA